MKRIYVNEKWCVGCHLCEYHCAFANSGIDSMVKALKGVKINPRVRVEEEGQVSFAVSCRHCPDPICVKSCITGALSVKDGMICVDSRKCVGCCTCVCACPYGAIVPDEEKGIVQKCQLCTDNPCKTPACVAACPNGAIVFEERGTEK